MEQVVFVAEHRLERCEMPLFAVSFIVNVLWLKESVVRRGITIFMNPSTGYQRYREAKHTLYGCFSQQLIKLANNISLYPS